MASKSINAQTWFLVHVLTVPLATWASEAPVNSVAGMRATMSSVGAAANVKINPQTCTSVNKVLPFGRMRMSFACPVPEAARPTLRAELVARNWAPESQLDGALFKLRNADQTVALYCEFKATVCSLRFDYAPIVKRKSELD